MHHHKIQKFYKRKYFGVTTTVYQSVKLTTGIWNANYIFYGTHTI